MLRLVKAVVTCQSAAYGLTVEQIERGYGWAKVHTWQCYMRDSPA
jgi:hypothetical protein